MDPVEESGGGNSCSKPEEFVVGGKSSLCTPATSAVIPTPSILMDPVEGVVE
jgi:hypothetical protein